jgi:hypothetical protein
MPEYSIAIEQEIRLYLSDGFIWETWATILAVLTPTEPTDRRHALTHTRIKW